MTPQLPITPDKLAAYAGTLREKEKETNELGAVASNIAVLSSRSTTQLSGKEKPAEEDQPVRTRKSQTRPSTKQDHQRARGDNQRGNTPPSTIQTTVTPTQHFPLVPEPKHSAPTYSEDARLTTLGTMALFQLWQAPNNMKDIEQLAAYFSVPPTVIHRELQELDLIPEEFSGEKITVEWMLKDARTQRERQREARERFLRDNEGRDVEGMYQFEEWRITTPHSSPIPINEFVLDPGHPETRPVPDNYLAAEDEVRAQEIEQAIDAGEIANAPVRNRGRRKITSDG